MKKEKLVMSYAARNLLGKIEGEKFTFKILLQSLFGFARRMKLFFTGKSFYVFKKLKIDENEIMHLLKHNGSLQIPFDNIPEQRRRLGCEYYLMYSFPDNAFVVVVIGNSKVILTVMDSNPSKWGIDKHFSSSAYAHSAQAIGFVPLAFKSKTHDEHQPSPSVFRVSCMYSIDGYVRTKNLFTVKAEDCAGGKKELISSKCFKERYLAAATEKGVNPKYITSLIVKFGASSEPVIVEIDEMQ